MENKKGDSLIHSLKYSTFKALGFSGKNVANISHISIFKHHCPSWSRLPRFWSCFRCLWSTPPASPAPRSYQSTVWRPVQVLGLYLQTEFPFIQFYNGPLHWSIQNILFDCCAINSGNITDLEPCACCERFYHYFASPLHLQKTED